MAPKLPTKSQGKRRRASTSSRSEGREMDAYYLPTECEARIQHFPSNRFTILRHMDLDALREKGFAFPELLEHQGLKQFLNLKGTYYPDLVREFYANLAWDREYEQNVSYVQGKYIDLIPRLFQEVAGLKSEGTYPCEAANPGWEDFNQVTLYQSCLRHPSLYMEGQKPKAGDMTVEDRLILYTVTYCLSPKTSSNHATPTQFELALVYAIKKRLLINWPMEIVRQMNSRAKSPKPQLLAYPVLISRILEHCGVDVSQFPAVSLKPSDELDLPVLHAMQIYQNERSNAWEWRDGKHFGEEVDEEETEEQPLHEGMEEDFPQNSQPQAHSNNHRLDELEQRIQGNFLAVNERLDSIQAQHSSLVSHIDQRFDAMETSSQAKFGQLTFMIKTMMSFGDPNLPPPPPPTAD